jgi:hypothetical protein
MPRNYIIDTKGTKEFKIKSTDYEKQRVAVMLCITVNNHKLPPYIIFFRKTLPKDDMLAKDVTISAQNMGG